MRVLWGAWCTEAAITGNSPKIDTSEKICHENCLGTDCIQEGIKANVARGRETWASFTMGVATNQNTLNTRNTRFAQDVRKNKMARNVLLQERITGLRAKTLRKI